MNGNDISRYLPKLQCAVKISVFPVGESIVCFPASQGIIWGLQGGFH